MELYPAFLLLVIASSAQVIFGNLAFHTTAQNITHDHLMSLLKGNASADKEIEKIMNTYEHQQHLLVRREATMCPKNAIDQCIESIDENRCADPDSEYCTNCLFWFTDKEEKKICQDYARRVKGNASAGEEIETAYEHQHTLVRRGATKCPKNAIKECIDENRCADPDSEYCTNCLFWFTDKEEKKICQEYARRVKAKTYGSGAH